jgi:signal peptidase I
LEEYRSVDTTQREQLQPASADGQPVSGDERVSLAKAFGGRSAVREVVETILLAAIIFLILNTATGRFQVRGSSMLPTLQDGQYLLISKLIYWFQPPQRGDIIVFHPPTNPSEDYIKRVIGLPGEQIEIQNGEVWVNGAVLQEPYITTPIPYSGSWVLQGDEYFVLGDNRANSSDSHTWGVLPKQNMIGKAWVSYWPPERWGGVSHHSFTTTDDQPVE